METSSSFPVSPVTEPTLATKLLRAVLAKTVLEIIAVCVIAALSAWQHFNPQLRGAIDVADEQRVAGWAFDPHRSEEKIQVQLFVDGKFIATRYADERRDDLVRAGVTRQPHHGFTFALDSMTLPAGTHNLQVYALRPASSGSQILLPLSEKNVTWQIR